MHGVWFLAIMKIGIRYWQNQVVLGLCTINCMHRIFVIAGKAADIGLICFEEREERNKHKNLSAVYKHFVQLPLKVD